MSAPRKSESAVGSWSIQFWPNIHMYCHRLVVCKGVRVHELECEDLPIKGNFIGVWLYNTKMPDDHRQELVHVLGQWGDQTGRRLKIYTDREVSHLNLGNGTLRTERTSPAGDSLE